MPQIPNFSNTWQKISKMRSLYLLKWFENKSDQRRTHYYHPPKSCMWLYFQSKYIHSKIHFLNRIKMRNWYILSPMKIPKQQFYNFWVKFSICKYHTRRNFINFWLQKGGKKIWIFAGFPDYWLKTDSEEALEFRVYKKCSQD